MDFKMTEEQELLMESIDEFFARGEFDEAYIQKCTHENRPMTEYNDASIKAGFGLLGLPEKYGGTPCDTVTLMMATERIGMYGYPSSVGKMLQADDMAVFGTPEQQDAVIGELQKGRNGFCLGFTEPGAGSDLNLIATSIEHKDGKVIINGHKTFTTEASRSAYMLCMCRDFSIKDKPANQTMTTVLLPMDAPGVTCKELYKLGCKDTTICETYIDNVVLPESAIVGKEGMGFMTVMKNFEVERLVVAACSLGCAVCAYNDALNHAATRKQFGQPVGNFELIQEKLCQMRIKIENMRNMLYKTAWEHDNGISIRVSADLCKLYCSQAGFEVCDDALQIMSGVGYTGESRVSRMWRDVRMHRIGAGTEQILIYTAGRQIVKEAIKKNK